MSTSFILSLALTKPTVTDIIAQSFGETNVQPLSLSLNNRQLTIHSTAGKLLATIDEQTKEMAGISPYHLCSVLTMVRVMEHNGVSFTRAKLYNSLDFPEAVYLYEFTKTIKLESGESIKVTAQARPENFTSGPLVTRSLELEHIAAKPEPGLGMYFNTKGDFVSVKVSGDFRSINVPAAEHKNLGPFTPQGLKCMLKTMTQEDLISTGAIYNSVSSQIESALEGLYKSASALTNCQSR